MTTLEPALTMTFLVVVDDIDLGAFTSCEGLGAEVVLEQREEGGNALFIHQLPVRLKYPNIKLTRPVLPGAGGLAAWFTRVVGGVQSKGTGHIEARDGELKKVASWGLTGIVPVRWTGPQFNVEQAKTATETLELAHHGYTEAP